MRSDELLWAICWVLIVAAIALLMLIKGCVQQNNCEVMLAECERGLEAMVNAQRDDDAGCE